MFIDWSALSISKSSSISSTPLCCVMDWCDTGPCEDWVDMTEDLDLGVFGVPVKDPESIKTDIIGAPSQQVHMKFGMMSHCFRQGYHLSFIVVLCKAATVSKWHNCKWP